jgi:cytochrome c peroxidase
MNKTNTNFNAFDRAFFYSRNHNPLSIGLYKTQVSLIPFIKETRLKTTAQTLFDKTLLMPKLSPFQIMKQRLKK